MERTMDFRNGRESDNVEDRRGQGGRGLRGGGKIGIGTIVLALVAMYFGIDPSVVLDTAMTDPAPVESTQTRPAAENAQARFASMVLADTEDTWRTIFQQGGATYREPKLVLYTGATRSACGVGQAEMGPFYCPADAKVYLDLAFFDELHHRFGAPGDFAQAYVIAHEIGHHVQNLLGISDKVQQARTRVSEREANQLSVRLELQDYSNSMMTSSTDRLAGLGDDLLDLAVLLGLEDVLHLHGFDGGELLAGLHFLAHLHRHSRSRPGIGESRNLDRSGGSLSGISASSRRRGRSSP
jgi:hypothetical protein